MSTTFGIKTSVGTIEIARRVGKGVLGVEFQILNEAILLMKEDYQVIPLDNTSQGIETVGDIIKALKAQEIAILKATKDILWEYIDDNDIDEVQNRLSKL